jgi:uncharacterized protein
VIRQTLGPDAGKAIDAHTHIFDQFPQASPKALGRMVQLAHHYGIGSVYFLANATGMLSAMGPEAPTLQLISDINSYTLAAMKLHPDFIRGFVYFNPAHPPSFIQEEASRCIVEGGMAGIKLETAVKTTDPRLDAIAGLAIDLGVPIVQHTWYKAIGNAVAESSPAEVVALARRFPECRIVLAHLGGGRERGVQDLVEHPNLYYDTSGSQPESGLVEYAVAQLGADRVLFGSDWPVRDFGVQLGRILGARLSAKERRLILHGNAQRLLSGRKGAAR